MSDKKVSPQPEFDLYGDKKKRKKGPRKFTYPEGQRSVGVPQGSVVRGSLRKYGGTS